MGLKGFHKNKKDIKDEIYENGKVRLTSRTASKLTIVIIFLLAQNKSTH